MGRKYTDNFYEIFDDYAILKIKYKNEYIDCYFDIEDISFVQEKHWRTSHKKNKVYIVTGKSGNKKEPLTYLHNYLMHYIPVPQLEVDHIDGNSCNNRKSNLRIVTRQANIDNTKARIDNKIGIRGISQISKTKKYKCDFSYHGKRFYFKYWNTIEEAVYNRKIAEEYFGIETLKKNPLAKQYIDLLTEEQKRLIENYVYNKIS